MTVAAALSGLCSAGVIAVISRTVSHHGETLFLLGLGFISLAADKLSDG
jgi:hypothetical protein